MNINLVVTLAVLFSVVPLDFFIPPTLKRKLTRFRRRIRRIKYQAYLQSSKWKTLRNQTLLRDNHTCQNIHCGSSDNLEVHHLTYKRLYKERLSDLKTLCRSCHKKEHGRKR